MKVKKFIYKIIHKKAGASDCNWYNNVIADGIWLTSKKEAFADGRKELVRMAESDRNGNNDQEIDEIIESIKAGFNDYNYDQHYYKVVCYSKTFNK